jgi:hypothetical protein
MRCWVGWVSVGIELWGGSWLYLRLVELGFGLERGLDTWLGWGGGDGSG